jgi:hypothetical protein
MVSVQFSSQKLNCSEISGFTCSHGQVKASPFSSFLGAAGRHARLTPSSLREFLFAKLRARAKCPE